MAIGVFDMIDTNLVIRELKKIIGFPLRNAGRACDVIWFGFGNLINKEDKRCGGLREVAEFALHIQCSWRLTSFEKIIVGSADKYIPSSEIKNYNNFDWDIQGANRCDEQLKGLFLNQSTELIVENIIVDKFGGIKVFLSEDILLDVMPDSSTNNEAWRFFQNEGETEHLIVTGLGIDWQ